jgi:hypothetical protein|tara:strand:- start:155 stop:457 length:303 start_codon:yes stop_codon:yes gene_type:complete
MATRYQFINKTKYDQAPAYIQQLYPSVVLASNDYYIDVSINDRLDLLAQDFYGDSKLWWVIAMANDLPGDSLFPPVGFQIRVPSDLGVALEEYQEVNNER